MIEIFKCMYSNKYDIYIKAPLHTFYLYKIVIIINTDNLKDFLKCY